ncbi:MAG: helix-turn-helix domain-containing protein [Clostridia bacterium]|nr:helix-turn-helix domain-containing protein [Clostridia bacterium]
MKQENIKFDLPQLSLNLKNVRLGKEHSTRDKHFHKAVELVRVEQGSILCHVDDVIHTLTRNEILLVNSGTIHKLECTKHATITYIQINIDKYSNQFLAYGNYMDRFLKSNHAKKLCIFHGENELSSIFDNIKHEFEQKSFCYEEYIKAYIFMLVAFMRRNQLLSDINSLCDRKKLTQLSPVIQYIDENYSTKLSLQELSDIINSDKYRLCRLFKGATGFTIFEYINFVRLLCAEEMLIKSQKNVSEIAFECGFASIQYFNRMFKESRGYTPRLYRKMFSELF